ncbi:MAG: CBS domain-containing protein [Hyphomicrobiales bacterium]|nr:CBS domain-containing protein [Hyphomicrobiales bacterium]
MSTQFIRVADVMQTSLHTVNGLASVQHALEQMGRENVSSLVVERRDENDEYGVITVQDIAAEVVSSDLSVDRVSIYQIMTKPALTLSADMNVRYAIRLLSRFGLTRALVTRGRKLEGLVTLRDLVLSGDDFKEITKPS